MNSLKQIFESLSAARPFNEDAEQLNIGDPVIITGNVQFKGKTGEIADFGIQNRFVVVNLYNYGKRSFHSSDVSYNEYDGEDDYNEEDDENLFNESVVTEGKVKELQDDLKAMNDESFKKHYGKTKAEVRKELRALQKKVVEGGDEDYGYEMRRQRRIDNPRPAPKGKPEPAEPYVEPEGMDQARKAVSDLWDPKKKKVAESAAHDKAMLADIKRLAGLL